MRPDESSPPWSVRSPRSSARTPAADQLHEQLGLEDDRAAEDDVLVDERDKALQILSLHGCSPLAGDRTSTPAYHAC